MDKELEYIYNTLASMSPKYREMGAGEFYNKLENDAEFYKKVYSWASASKLPLTELGNIEPVKKKEPTPSSSGVSPSSESEEAQPTTPEKPKEPYLPSEFIPKKPVVPQRPYSQQDAIAIGQASIGVKPRFGTEPQKSFLGLPDTGKIPTPIPENADVNWYKKNRPDLLREDGTIKGKGFFGGLQNKDGKESTELSITTGDVENGKEVLIPTLVPTLTTPEVDYILSGKYNPKSRTGLDAQISEKAIDFAKDRKAKKLPYFATKDEEGKFKPQNDMSIFKKLGAVEEPPKYDIGKPLPKYDLQTQDAWYKSPIKYDPNAPETEESKRNKKRWEELDILANYEKYQKEYADADNERRSRSEGWDYKIANAIDPEGQKKFSAEFQKNFNQKKSLATKYNSLAGDVIQKEVEYLYKNHGDNKILRSNELNVMVPDMGGIQRAVKNRLRELDLPDDGVLYQRMKNELAGYVSYKYIEPKINGWAEKLFIQETKKTRSQAAQEEYEKFIASIPEIGKIQTQTKLTAEYNRQNIESEAKRDGDIFGQMYKSSVKKLQENISQDEDVKAYTNQVWDALLKEQQRLVNLGQKTPDQANAYLKSKEVVDKVSEDVNNFATKKYGKDFTKLYEEYVNSMHNINRRADDRLQRQNDEITRVANAQIDKIIQEKGKDFKYSTELQAKLKKAYKDAYRIVMDKQLEENLQKVKEYDSFDLGLALTSPSTFFLKPSFITANISALGQTLSALGATFGDKDIEDLGERMDKNFETPFAGIKSFADALDPTKFSTGAGLFTGRMIPSIVGAGLVAYTTKNAPVALRILATGLTRWGGETADMMGSMKREVFEKTGDLAKANEASATVGTGQLITLPFHMFEMDLFFGKTASKIFNKIPTAVGKATAATVTDFAGNYLEEIYQGGVENAARKGEGVLDSWKYINAEENKKLFYEMLPLAPMSIVGGARAGIQRQSVQNSVNKYIQQSGILEKIKGKDVNQYLGNVYLQYGKDFTETMTGILYQKGSITKEQLESFDSHIKEFESFTELMSKTQLGERSFSQIVHNPFNFKTKEEKQAAENFNKYANSIVSYRIYSEYQDAKNKLNEEKDPDAKALLEQNLKDKEKQYKDFFAGKGAEMAAVIFKDGSQYALTYEELNEVLDDPETAKLFSLGVARVNLFTAPTNNKAKLYSEVEKKYNELLKEYESKRKSQGTGAEPSEADAGRPVGGEERPVSEDSGLGVTDTGVAEEAKPTAEPTATEGQAEPVSEPLGGEKPIPNKTKVMGKDVNVYNNYIPAKSDDVEPDAMYVFNASSKDGIPSLLHDIAYKNTSEVNGEKWDNWHATINGEDLLKFYPENKKQKEPVGEPLGSEAPQAEAEKTQQPLSDIDAEIERLKKEKENELNNVGIKQKERAFSQLRDEKDEDGKVIKVRTPEEKLNAINSIERNVAEGSSLTKEEQREVQKIKDKLASEGYEVPSLLGKQYHQGLRVIVTNSILDESLAEGEEVISKILIPAVMYNGKMVQTAQVEVTVGTKKGGLTREQWLEQQKKKEKRTDKINAKYDKQIAELEAKKKTEQTQKQNEQAETTKENVKPVSEGVSGVRTETEAGKESTELRAEGKEEVKQDTVPEKARKKLNSFKEKKGVKIEQKESEEKQNAVQEPSTEKEVPPTGEGGKDKSQGGEGVGQSKQGKEAAQQGETKKEIIPNGSQIKVKSSTTGAVTTYTYANGKWTFVDSNNRTNNETAKMNETLSTSFMQGDNERVRTSDELKAMSAVNNIKNSLKSSNIEVKVIDNEEEFDKEANKQKSVINDNVGGVFLSDDGVIYLNGKKLVGEWGDVIAWHEGIHPIINILRNTNPKLLDRIMRGAEQFAKGNPQLDGVRKFAEQYRMDVSKNADGKYDVVDDGEVVATFDSEAEANSFVDAKVKDEFITELFARITAGDIKLKDLPTGFKQTLIELINKILKALKIDINVSALNEAEFNKYARMISETLSEGRDISEIVGEENVGEYQNNLVNEDGTKFSQFSISNKFKNLISGVKYEYISDTEEFLELIKNGRITNDKFLKDFNEFYVMLHIPDNAFTGKIYKDKELLVDGKGGVYFPIKYNKEGYFWASTEAAVDKLVAILNETRKANPDQKVRLALVSSRPEKIMSSANASNAMIDVLFSKALDKRAQLTDVQVKESIINGLETAQIQIIEDFNEDIKKAKEKIAKEEDVTVKEKLQKSLDELIRKGYDVVPSIDINSSVAKFKSILADFYSPDNSSFQTKKTINQNILSSLSGLINSKEESDYREKLKKEYKEQLEQAKKEGNQRNIDRINKKIEDLPKLKKLESRPVAEEILNFLGMSKNAIRLKSTGGRLSASNLMQGFSDLLGEPMLKGEPSENIYAILELNGDVEKVKIPKEIEHGSYPFAVKAKDTGNVVLHILQDRQNWKDNVLDPETNEKIVDNKRALELMPTTAGITFVPVKVSTSSNAQMSQGEREIPQFSKGSRGRRAYDETGFISVPTMVEIVKSNNPNYLGDVMEHIIEMGDKLKKGAVTTSDLSKAYMMAVSSIRSGDINVETFENAIGQKVDKVFLEPNNKIRTEGAMAYLLTTDRGADLIKHIESGSITKEDREFIANSMKPFGMFGEGQSKYESLFGQASKDQINLTNINEFKNLLKNGVKSTDELFDKIRKLKQISQGKIGFVANFLGIGTRGVIDAREIQGWLRGTTFKGERSESEAEIEKQLNKNLVNLTPLQKEILDRMKEVGRALGVPENLAAYIGHHMIWDAVADERTTHDGLYLAMKQNQQDFDSRLRELSEREKTNAQMSQGERGEREKINWEESKIGRGDKAITERNENVKNAAEDLYQGKIDLDEYTEIVNENSPIKPITEFIKPAKAEDIKTAVGIKSEGKINLDFPKGKKVGLRLDIPAYINKNIWAITVHEQGRTGVPLSYNNVARIKNVEFITNPAVALDIARHKELSSGNKMGKATIARMTGEWVPIEGDTAEAKGESAMKMVEEIKNNPEWIQIGMNPFRFSHFYDRATGNPIVKAEDVIQIGGLVYGKNVETTSKNDPRFTVTDAKGNPIIGKGGKPIQFSQGERGERAAKEVMPEDIETEITDEEKDIILQAMNLYYDMRDNTKTAPQKKEIKREREKLLNENENIKRIFDNVQDINKQLQNKELITKKGDCL